MKGLPSHNQMACHLSVENIFFGPGHFMMAYLGQNMYYIFFCKHHKQDAALQD
jgi:hypothetical protein